MKFTDAESRLFILRFWLDVNFYYPTDVHEMAEQLYAESRKWA